MKHTLTACLLGLITLASFDASAQIRRTNLVLDDGSGNLLTIVPPPGMSGAVTWAVPASTSGITAGSADGQIAWWDNTAGSWKPTSNILLTNTTGALQLGAASVAGKLLISDGGGTPKYVTLNPSGSMLSTPINLTLPATSGTIALLSDITAGVGDVVAANTNTFTNTNTFSSATPIKLTNAAPVITLGTTPTNATLTIKDGEAVPNTLLTLTDNGTNGTLTVANFSGNLTGDVTGNASGNAGTATKLQTARTIAGTSFDGTTNISIDANNLSGSTLNSGVTASSLTSVGTLTGLGISGQISTSSASPIFFNNASPVITMKTGGQLNLLNEAATSLLTFSDLSSVGNLSTGVINASTGFRVASAAATGNYLRGDGANFVSAGLNMGDAASGTLAVNRGGTGSGSLTQYAVLLGNNTSAVGTASPGTSGQVLTSNGSSANPSFQSISSIISGAAMTNMTNNATMYWSSTGGWSDVSTQSGPISLVVPKACTLRKFYVELEAAPGAGNSWAITLYNATTSTAGPSVTISGTATTGSDTSTSLSASAGDKIVIKVVPTSTPTAKRASWQFEMSTP